MEAINNSTIFLVKVETTMPIKAQIPTSHCLLTEISVTNTQKHVFIIVYYYWWGGTESLGILFKTLGIY
jgi:hypothetical protein